MTFWYWSVLPRQNCLMQLLYERRGSTRWWHFFSVSSSEPPSVRSWEQVFCAASTSQVASTTSLTTEAQLKVEFEVICLWR